MAEPDEEHLRKTLRDALCAIDAVLKTSALLPPSGDLDAMRRNLEAAAASGRAARGDLERALRAPT